MSLIGVVKQRISGDFTSPPAFSPKRAAHSPVARRPSPVARRHAAPATLLLRPTYQPHATHAMQPNTPAFSAAVHSLRDVRLARDADFDIVEQIRNGASDAAFELLLPRYRDRVYRLALSILRDPAAAEDVAQDVFLRLWRSLGGYNGSAALSTWIYAITRNTAISALRKRRPHVSLDESDDGDSPALQLAAPEQDDSATASVERLLDKLPERYRRAVALFYMEDQSYEQTAAALGLPLGTVKALLHRARKRLIALAGESMAA